MRRILTSAMIGFLVSAIGFVVIYLTGRTEILSCDRSRSDQIDCAKSSVLLGLIPVGSDTVTNLKDAWVDEDCDDEGCTYRVMFNTVEGTIPLTVYRSSGNKSKQVTVDTINQFIHNPQEEHLDVRIGPSFIGMLIGGIVIIAGPIVTFSRVRRSIDT